MEPRHSLPIILLTLPLCTLGGTTTLGRDVSRA
ncbi:hypothetical protein COCCU_05260 [Corynebacterium occultum]|uniref:Uncharacterized protein n=1 Tax=Corynebacterium occultum TaxID=2675219 RepID=A0A6B8WKP8_9CORY|nr:hypothetical protein COCCU_05260 [Corynebacterium occultum]